MKCEMFVLHNQLQAITPHGACVADKSLQLLVEGCGGLGVAVERTDAG